MHPHVPYLLSAARLAAGFVVMVAAAEMLGLAKYSLHRFENGGGTPSDELFNQMAELYGVSAEFLRTGKAQSNSERLASRLQSILEKSDNPDFDLGLGGAKRLSQIRVERGFTSARRAAEASGWKIATYAAHESGAAKMTAERMACYALSFSARPEFAVFGQGRPFDAESKALNWKQQYSTMDMTGEDRSSPHHWKWLGKERGTTKAAFPLVEITDGKFTVLTGGSAMLPNGLLPDLFSGPRYGLIKRSPSLVEVFLIDPTSADGPSVIASIDGEIEVSSTLPEDYQPSDVVSDAPDTTQKIVLGLLTAKISMEF